MHFFSCTMQYIFSKDLAILLKVFVPSSCQSAYHKCIAAPVCLQVSEDKTKDHLFKTYHTTTQPWFLPFISPKVVTFSISKMFKPVLPLPTHNTGTVLNIFLFN